MKNTARVAVRPEASSCHRADEARRGEAAAPVRARQALKVKSGVRAGDFYMHTPRGSNNRPTDP